MPYDRSERILELIDRLGENEDRYRTFLDASPWGILVADKTFSIVFINKTLERLSGYHIAEVLGRHVNVLMPKEDRAVHAKHEVKYMAEPHHRLGNHGHDPKILTKTGQIVHVEISLSPTRLDGQQLYFASIRPLDTFENTIEDPHFRGL